MKLTKYPVDRIIQILSEAELPSNSISGSYRKYSISRNTFDKWRQKLKCMPCDEAKRLKVLEDENLRLKRILADKGTRDIDSKRYC